MGVCVRASVLTCVFFFGVCVRGVWPARMVLSSLVDDRLGLILSRDDIK